MNSPIDPGSPATGVAIGFTAKMAAVAVCLVQACLMTGSVTGHAAPPETMQPGAETRRDRPPLFHGGLGRYQLTAIVLQKIGMLKADHREWTGKHGVVSAAAFLRTPVAQEKALEDVMTEIRRSLAARGVLAMIGLEIRSPKGDFRITESGLMAASHAEGAGSVAAFLKSARRRGGAVSASDQMPHRTITFSKIENRLRDFADIEYRARRP